MYALVAGAYFGTKAGIIPSAFIAFIIISPGLAWYWLHYGDRAYVAWSRWTIVATEGVRRWYVIAITVALFIIFPIWGWTLKVGDMTPGSALLFPDHPYNIGYHKLNDKFLGASQLIVIADTKQPDGIKNAATLGEIEEFSDYMQGAEGSSGSLTIIDVVKRLAQLYHDGDPKWGLIPESPKEIGQLFYVFTSSASAGDLDRFMDPSGRYGTVITLFRGYSHDIIANSIDYGKRFGHGKEGHIDFKFAGGIFGILAAVNEAVENSYWTNLGLIFFLVFLCLYLTYGSFVAAALLMIPVILSQLASEAMMVWLQDRPERELVTDRRRRCRRRRRLRHLPLQSHDRRLRRGRRPRRGGRLRHRHDRQGDHLHRDHDDRRHRLLLPLRPEVPGRNGSAADPADDLQQVRRPHRRAGAREGAPAVVPARPDAADHHVGRGGARGHAVPDADQ
jgi:hypothetical protein